MNESILAPAKINLGLSLLGKRSDNFHELRTVFQEIPFFDQITYQKSNKKTFHSNLLASNDNLVVKAWEALEKYTSRELTCSLTLNKRIPSGAGLGGGSSDAAKTLVLLNKCFQLGYDDNTLESIAATVGSDCAFFIKGGCQLGEGRGEILTPLPSKYEGCVLLGIPSFEIATKDVFQKVNLNALKSIQRNELPRFNETSNEWLSYLENDLLEAAMMIKPELKDFIEYMKQLFRLPIHLSGSGSCCFGLLPEAIDAPKNIDSGRFILMDCRRQTTLWDTSL